MPLHQVVLSNSLLRELVIVFGRDLDIYVFAAVLMFFLFHEHDKKIKASHDIGMSCIREMILLTFSAFIAWLTTAFLKIVFASPRPFELYQNIEPLFIFGGGDSFPSGHATIFAALTMMVFILHKKAGWILAILTFLISISRVAAGIHFPIDVIVGWIIGVGVSYFIYNLFKPRMLHKHK
jgi:membrane-associated phospholipid phosphatase